MTIRIVTDSTSDIPPETAAALGIVVVPAYVNIDNQSYRDGVDLSRGEFYEQLPGYSTPPTTAAPSPGAFTEAYNQVAAEGATEVLSIHVASSLSAMLNAAHAGAEATDAVKVSLFDSHQVTMGLGLLSILAAEAAAAGRSMAEIVAMLNDRVEHTYVFGLLDTLEYLRRSGRVSWADFGLGTLLRIKPLIKVHMGQVEILDKIRTSRRALDRFLEIIGSLGPLDRMALLHIRATDDDLTTFRQQTQFLTPKGITPLAVEITPAIGAHIGPGGRGVACILK